MITMSTFTSSSFINSYNVTFPNSTRATISSTLPVWIRIVTLTCMILIDISAFLGNLLVICAFFRTRRLQTVTNYFIASLAFADALVAIFVLPLSIYCYQRDRSWKLGLILCDLWVSSDVLLCTSSILNLTCISVDRYMAITKPLTYTAYRSKFLARVMILLVWIVSVVITCPPIFGWRDKDRRKTVEQEYKCDLNSARGYVVYSALGSFYIPGVVMIFVYIRIFMVVYDRENLIKKFHHDQSSNISIKSNLNGSLPKNTDVSNNKKRFQRFPSCCCFCLRKKSSQENQSSRTSLPHYSFNNCSIIEQKQNGHLIYRFTTTTNNNNSNSPVHTQTSSLKTSFFCRPCRTSTKKMSNTSDEICQYRRNYLSHIAAEYQFRNDDSPCYELKTFENSISPLIKCRSRSFEQSITSKIRDLNTELSHSRQLKAAAAAAAAVSTTPPTDSKDTLKQENEIEQLIVLKKETDDQSLFQSINEDLDQTTQSLNTLTRLSIVQTPDLYKKSHSRQSNVVPMRSRSTTNPSIIHQDFSNSPTYPYFMRQKQSLPEPTRINRRIKSSRLVQNSPSALLIENFKQQHKIPHSSSLRSTQSSRSLASIHHFANSNDNNLNQKYSWFYCCCCSSSSTDNCSPNKTKQIFTYTPNHSLTNDDDDDEKISSNEISNRTALYTPVHSSSIPRTSTSTTGTPGDVHRRERIRFMKEQKTAKTLAVVVGGFILLWLPFFIMYIIPTEKFSLNDQTITLITWLGYFNSVINPFIYAYCSKQFRMAFWNITFGLCVKKSSVLVPINNKTKQSHQHRLNA